MGTWSQEDCVQLATIRVPDPARAFYNANLDFRAADVTWEGFKAAFRERFRVVRRDQFYFSKDKKRAARYFWQKHRRNVRYKTRAQTRGEIGFQKVRQ